MGRSSMGEWQSIESAPFHVDVLVTSGGVPCVAALCDDDGVWLWMNDREEVMGDGFTHWMHLPPPPVKGRAVKRKRVGVDA